MMSHLIKPKDNERSPLWEKFKKEFAKTHPKQCAVCGRKNKIQLHHKLPFHIDQTKELDPKNVLWLCEGPGTGDHHIFIGHLENFQSWNVDVVEDAKAWKKKILSRPKG